jgi:uncharacterized membrane protein YfcA
VQIYLPIAELSVNAFVLLGLGGAVGFLSGMFGVGGGFLMTPLLIFTGIPPADALGPEAVQIVATSKSGVLAHWRRKAVDFKMAGVLLAGGAVGSVTGVLIFSALRNEGQIDLFISLAYVVFLGVIGALMMNESLRAIRAQRQGRSVAVRKPGTHGWIHGLPLKVRFRRSRLYISAVPPLLIGLLVGILSAIMGVGGGFIMVPAMIYLLRMPTNVVVGTSLFQIMFVTALASIMHATLNQTVDIVLAMLLLVGGVLGAQIGVRVGHKLRGEQLRALLAAMVLLVCLRLAWDLVATPEDLFTVMIGGGA